MTYTKDTFDPAHVGRKVKWKCDGLEGIGLLSYFNGQILVDESINDYILVSSYELIDEPVFPMPLKEAYDRGLLKVGQKVRITDNSIGFDVIRTINGFKKDEYGEFCCYSKERTQPICVIDSESYVEILEEPKEEKVVKFEDLDPKCTASEKDVVNHLLNFIDSFCIPSMRALWLFCVDG